jgi:protocatechuate 3,4-dioxygenase beta subunit
MEFPRRRVLAAAIAGAAAWGLPSVLRAVAAEALAPTPQQTPGPFYPLSYPADADNDLVHVAGQTEPAKGTVTRVAGRILDRAGRPLSGARVEIWQCDDNGRYHNVQDGGGGRQRDDNFQGFGRTVTDVAGGYSFTTIRPVPYPGRTPHIHFAVAAPGLSPFVTQMYVAGEPLNERDSVLQGVRDPAARARLIVPLQPAPEIGQTALAASFDIVLDGTIEGLDVAH